MSPLEQLFRLEIEFQRRRREQSIGVADAAGLHTSYALQSGYEPLLRQLGKITAQDLEHVTARLMMTADTRDILAARASLRQMLGIRLFDP